MILPTKQDRALQAIIRKLEAAELQHLRAHVNQLAQRIEDLTDMLVSADAQADFWREQVHEMTYSLMQEGKQPGLTKEGEVVLIDSRDALINRLAALNPDAGEIGAGMLAQLVAEAREISGSE